MSQYQNKDSRIKVITNEKNLKLPLTLNVGFSVANGEYLTWTSDDNLCRSWAIARMVEGLNGDDSLSMVYSDYTNIDVNNCVLNEVKLQEPEYMVTGNVCGACFLYRAESARKIGEYDANLLLQKIMIIGFVCIETED